MRPTKTTREILLAAFALLALTLTSLHATAEEVDEGDFADGDMGAPPNGDSEFVPGLGMGEPSYGGTGCPAGTISTILSPDQRTLSVMFDAYVARAGGNSGTPRARMGCQLNIPFSVPAGYRVQVVKMDYRGFTSIPSAGRSTFGAGFRYLEINGSPTNAKRVLRAKVFIGPKQENFTLTSIMQGSPWSPCGKSFVLAAESMVNVMSNRSNEETVTTVDSVDAVQTPVKYSLRWQRCDGRDEPSRPPGRPVPPPRPPRR